MMIKTLLLLASLSLLLLGLPSLAAAAAERGSLADEGAEKKSIRARVLSSKSSKSGKGGSGIMKLILRVTNLSLAQPFSPFFVMVHDDSVRLFEFGEPASPELARLAEDGDPVPLFDTYGKMPGVLSVAIHNEGAPYFGGSSTNIEVTVTRDYPYVTIATMGINANDLLLAINGEMLYPGLVLYGDGLDGGSEENNELCVSIPGPACASINASNVESGNGEGYVFVHPGFHGVGDLAAPRYDWRNPMMRTEVFDYEYYYYYYGGRRN